jgi:hypothetical protein
VAAEGRITGIYKQTAGERIAVHFDIGRNTSVPLALLAVIAPPEE